MSRSQLCPKLIFLNGAEVEMEERRFADLATQRPILIQNGSVLRPRPEGALARIAGHPRPTHRTAIRPMREESTQYRV